MNPIVYGLIAVLIGGCISAVILKIRMKKDDSFDDE